MYYTIKNISFSTKISIIVKKQRKIMALDSIKKMHLVTKHRIAFRRICAIVVCGFWQILFAFDKNSNVLSYTMLLHNPQFWKMMQAIGNTVVYFGWQWSAKSVCLTIRKLYVCKSNTWWSVNLSLFLFYISLKTKAKVWPTDIVPTKWPFHQNCPYQLVRTRGAILELS